MFSALHSRDGILKTVSQEKLMEFFIGSPVNGKPIKSPFREDTNPSCVFWKSDRGILYFKDWSRDVIMDVFEVGKKITGLSTPDLYKYIIDNIDSIKKCSSTELHKESDITYRVIFNANFPDRELSWWKRYGITETTLLKNNVYSARAVGINGSPAYRSTVNNPIYIYSIPTTSRLRIYRPLAEKAKKWRGNLSQFDIFGWHCLPFKSKVLIITSSLKDAMVLQEMGFPSIAPVAESVLIIEDVMKQLKKRFKYIFVMMDDDPAGIQSADKYCRKYKLLNMTLGFNGKGKDVSDVVVNTNFWRTKKWIKKLIKKALKT